MDKMVVKYMRINDRYSVVFGKLQQVDDGVPAGSDWLLLAYISLLGSAASYGVFFYNASKGNLTALSSLTFSTPCFAAASGYLFFGESLTPLQLFGAAVTLGGVFLISRPQASSE